MFKPGQIVKSILTGGLYEITNAGGNGWVRARNMRSGMTTSIQPEILVLVGNNYQPKDINKALREVRTS